MVDEELVKKLAKVCGEAPKNIRVLHEFDGVMGRFLGLPGDYEWYYVVDTSSPTVFYLVGEDEEGNLALLKEMLLEDLIRLLG